VLLPSLLPGQAPTLEQSVSLRTPSGVRLSPDGAMVAYTVNKANWDVNAFETEIWIAKTGSGERFRLTGGKKSSGSPVWAPDGKRIAFVSDRDGKRQIYLIAPAGGEGVALTEMENGVDSFEWLPDGSAIVFTAAEPEPAALKDRKKKFGEFQVVKGDYSYTNLWLLKVLPIGDAGASTPPKPQRLTEGTAESVQSFEISPDGRKIAYAAVKQPDLSAEPSDLYVLTIADRMRKPLVERKGPDSNPVWSPDGKQIAFVTADEEPYYYFKNPKVAIVDVDGGKPRPLPVAFDERMNLLRWTADGIYFSGLQKTTAHLFRANAASGAVTRVSSPSGAVLQGISFSGDARHVAFTGSMDGRFAEVYASALQPFAPKVVSAFSEQLKEYKMAQREVIRWKSTDGTEVEGVLIKPVDFDPARKYPLLVVVHGGPTGIDMPVVSPDRYYPIERFVAKGALVLRPNYRGSAGYGEKFRSLNVRNLGVGDAWDVLSGVDSLIAKGWVDGERVGCMGWSQGGYISAFLTTSSTRFKAVSVGAGISNWMTYYVNTDIHPFTRQYLQATPWEDPAIYAKTSPMTYLKQAKTPTLIQHGEFDKRVPIPNAYELFQGLEDQGVPVRMYVYKGFGHGITKPKEMLAVLQHNYEFFSEYIWGETPAQ
jgi:dipeptidyl aminopeptidase/acylaminoacyl peptidase